MASPVPVPAWAPGLLLAAALVTLSPSAAAAATVPTDFADETAVIGGPLASPVGMAFLPDGRLLVIEQKTARIRLFVQGALSATDPVATLTGVRTAGWEQGLLGVAVDPGWPGRPYVYVHCNDLATPTIRVSRYTVAGDVAFSGDGHLTLDPATRYDLLDHIPDERDYHNGGTVRFGTDGTLLVSLGDDADRCAAQDSSLLKGKILRLDVTRLPAGAGGPAPFALLTPPGNPWASAPDSNARVVWARGLRNPFRFQVDPANGALFVGDVGEGTWEELDRVAAGGRNLGWPAREGPAPIANSCLVPLATGDAPVYAYDRVGQSASIIAGPVYRRPVAATHAFPPDYQGSCFLGDYYSGFLRRLSGSGDTWGLAPAVPGQPSATDWGQGFESVSDWAVGPDGALWYCVQGTGEIRRIRYTGTVAVAAPPVAGARFDAPRPSPARGAVALRYVLTRPSRVSLAILDAGGRRVRVLESQVLREASPHDASWDGLADDGRPAPPGIYFARLEAGGSPLHRRFALVR